MEKIVGRLASRSHGVVTRRQLLAAGVSREEIAQRLAAGALLREHRGVYRVGHRAPSVEACGARGTDPPDRTTHRGIPITTVPFTLIALAAQLPSDGLARA